MGDAENFCGSWKFENKLAIIVTISGSANRVQWPPFAIFSKKQTRIIFAFFKIPYYRKEKVSFRKLPHCFSREGSFYSINLLALFFFTWFETKIVKKKIYYFFLNLLVALKKQITHFELQLRSMNKFSE